MINPNKHEKLLHKSNYVSQTNYIIRSIGLLQYIANNNIII